MYPTRTIFMHICYCCTLLDKCNDYGMSRSDLLVSRSIFETNAAQYSVRSPKCLYVEFSLSNKYIVCECECEYTISGDARACAAMLHV